MGEKEHLRRLFTQEPRKDPGHRPAEPRYLLTELGVGYRLADE